MGSQPVAVYHGARQVLVPVENATIYWPGHRTEPPQDVPECGFLGDAPHCQRKESPTLLIVVTLVTVLSFFGMAIVALLFYRRVQLETQLANFWWSIKWEDIAFPERSPKSASSLATNDEGLSKGSPPMDQGVIKNLKQHYRSRFVNRVLLCVDSDKSYVVNVLSAISILSDACRAVTQDAMRNCFRYAGFVAGSEDEDSDTVQYLTADMPPAAASDIFDDLRASGVDVGGATFEDFTNIDSAVLPCAELNDDKIVYARSSNRRSWTATPMMTCHQRQRHQRLI
ncbi:hypothetical protein HPB48_014207 [Haemaphysalis longicornis]|uniref:DDE-1 domain-containing protein n=1 Tax=Haemaphysalis longicornis TaxID=44386 RepID=A0A9J6FJ84_HAELO|nr:hypothetical protein HPB48_014207 [Haemaphysalis longicornis]